MLLLAERGFVVVGGTGVGAAGGDGVVAGGDGVGAAGYSSSAATANCSFRGLGLRFSRGRGALTIFFV